MTCEQAIAYIEDRSWSSTRLGLDRTRVLLHALGDPQKRLKFIHVAGSNGKGSTCAMVESVLRAAGYRTGLYTSPHIQNFRERIQVCGEKIPEEVLARITGEARMAADAMNDHPSQFELCTAIAMVYFLEAECDIVVLEVGMGGALDSTNAIDAPEVAIITNIGLEHTEYLGTTLEEIAATKAGIIKSGCDCVCYNSDPTVIRTIAEACVRHGVPLYSTDFTRVVPIKFSLEGQTFRWGEKTYELPLLGWHQLKNAATALTALEVLRSRKWSIPEAAMVQGLSSIRWPARFEVLSREPLFILDGGHNPQCAQTLGEMLGDYLPGKKAAFLMGVLADKDWQAMVESVRPYAARFLCVTPESPRAVSGKELAAYLRAQGEKTEVFDSIDGAISAALTQDAPTVAFGSLYMAGHIRASFLPVVKASLAIS